MQRQQEIEPAPKVGTFANRQRPPRPRRSVGELLAAWLLILWGLSCAWVVFMTYVTDTVKWPLFALFLHGVCCLVGGTLALLRFRRLATGLVWGAAVAIMLIGVLFIFREPTLWTPRWRLDLSFGNLRAFVVCMAFATLFFFLGRWLGSQEDSEA